MCRHLSAAAIVVARGVYWAKPSMGPVQLVPANGEANGEAKMEAGRGDPKW